MRSVMTHQFSRVPQADIPRSTFDRSHGHKTTFDAGILVPFFVDEALPGDTFNCNVNVFARMATPIFPIMDNMMMDTHFFAVPIRLIWDNWIRLQGEQKNPGDSTDYLVPQVLSGPGGFPTAGMFDYMGIPPAVPDLSVSALWPRAYNLIYNEWFRDENLVARRPVPTGDGPDIATDYALCRRGKRHDYFTSCLPWPQKGPGVTIPLGTSAPIYGALWVSDADNTIQGSIGTDATGFAKSSVLNQNPLYVSPGNPLSMYADLSKASAATINTLRQAFQVQKIYERDARGGTRYTEMIRAHFGVTSPDARLQRPEYLGGGSSPVNISPVPQTSGTGQYAESPQGSMAGFGTISASQHAFTSSFTEHCVIIGLVSVRADLTYQQGIDRMWHRRTRFDFYMPALSHIGEQAVYAQEILATGNTTADKTVFGYQERYAEYRYKPSKISGLFRSSTTTPLDQWHLSQQFTAVPTLSGAFIEENPPLDRCIAIPSEPHFLFDSFFKLRCTRPMPVYGVPGLIDHF